MEFRTSPARAVLGAALALLTLSIGAPGQPNPHPTLAIGSAAPDFSLPGVDGKTHTLREYGKSPLLMVMFICNHCPTSQLYEDRIAKLVADYRPKGVAFVAIEPNDPKAILLSELAWTDVTDDFEGMKIRAAFKHFDFPYLYDGATQSVAQAYGPKATPHVFLFDKDRKLRYEGRIDDNQREPLVKTLDARAALDAALAGKAIEKPSTPVFGCSTKWKSKIDNQLAELQKIESQPVTLEMASAGDLEALRANAGDKVLLVNFWATWCGPCVTEFPDLQTTYRMFKSRDFDMVTVATNMPDEKAGVMKTLQAQHATSRNLLFASTDTYAMQAAFDAHWDSGVPFTMLIAPGGKVLYQRQGDIDIVELRRAILPHLEDETFKGHPGYWAKITAAAPKSGK